MTLHDIEAVLIQALLDSPEVSDVVGDRVWPEPIAGAERPFLTLRRISGGSELVWLDDCIVELAAWADRRGTARDLCHEAHAVVHGLDQNQPEAVVAGVFDVNAPRSIPDPETGRPRYISEVRVTSHPAGDSS